MLSRPAHHLPDVPYYLGAGLSGHVRHGGHSGYADRGTGILSVDAGGDMAARAHCPGPVTAGRPAPATVLCRAAIVQPGSPVAFCRAPTSAGIRLAHNVS